MLDYIISKKMNSPQIQVTEVLRNLSNFFFQPGWLKHHARLFSKFQMQLARNLTCATISFQINNYAYACNTWSTSTVKQGTPFLANFSFKDLALWEHLKHFTRLSGLTLKYISLAVCMLTPSIKYSSKTCAWGYEIDM